MFIITRRFTRTRAVLSVLLLGIFLAGTILLVGACQRNEDAPPPAAATNEERLRYLASLGWEVETEPKETLHLQLPAELSGTEYEDYNSLQLSQGFDLGPCAGKTLARYTYEVKNYPGRSDPVQVNLYCCDGIVVAGDVMALGENGFQTTLVFPLGE